MTGARTAIALYVAVALHAVALLFLLLAPLPQTGAGDGIGLTLAGGGSVLAAPGVPSVRPSAPSKSIPVAAARAAGPSPEREPADTAPPAPHAERPAAEVAVTGFSDGPSSAGSGGPGAGPAHAGGGGTDGYFARLRTHLAAFRRAVPDVATGRAEVRFTVLADGRVAELVLERSSGSERLDAEALALVARAQPLPPPPHGGSLRVTVPIYAGG